MFATGFFLAAVACFGPAGRSLSEISRPHDLFALSFLAASLFVAFFSAATLACLFPARVSSSAPRRRKELVNLALALSMVGLSLLVIASETPTSFVSWDQVRGAPLPWLENGHFYGPCLGQLCRTYWPTSVRPLSLLFNLILIFAAIHVLRRRTERHDSWPSSALLP